MIYELIIFTGGIVTGYFLTKTGYSDIFIENISEKIKKEEAKNTSYIIFPWKK